MAQGNKLSPAEVGESLERQPRRKKGVLVQATQHECLALPVPIYEKPFIEQSDMKELFQNIEIKT